MSSDESSFWFDIKDNGDPVTFECGGETIQLKIIKSGPSASRFRIRAIANRSVSITSPYTYRKMKDALFRLRRFSRECIKLFTYYTENPIDNGDRFKEILESDFHESIKDDLERE